MYYKPAFASAYLTIWPVAGLIVSEHLEYTRAGQQSLVWDGTDELENRVVPGAYIADLSIEGDAQKERIRRVVSAVY